MIIYLYHKRHRITGLNYFGKTTVEPYNYIGSGVYWKRHLQTHGSDVETVQVWEFTDQDECSDFALQFSRENNIVESKEWANLKNENGQDGGDPGPIGRRKISESKLGKKHSPEQNIRKSMRQKGKPKPLHYREKYRGENHFNYGRSRPDVAERVGEKHPNFGRTWKKTPEQITKQSGDNNPMKDPKWQMTCEYCGFVTNKSLYNRWHGGKCKNRR